MAPWFVPVEVVGRPGSGKTTAVRHMAAHVQRKHRLPVHRFTDYHDLLGMATAKDKRFRSHPHGFDVLDISVYPEALKSMEQRVEAFLRQQGPAVAFIIMEFARGNYQVAVEAAGPLIQRSHVLFVDADPQTCLNRIHGRVANSGLDNHGWSDHIMLDQFGFDNRPYFEGLARQQNNGAPLRLTRVVDNGAKCERKVGRLGVAAREFADSAIAATLTSPQILREQRGGREIE